MLNQFMRAEEVARELEVSKSYAYKLIQQLNAELREKGYITIAGRVNRQYFRERLYGHPSRCRVYLSCVVPSFVCGNPCFLLSLQVYR